MEYFKNEFYHKLIISLMPQRQPVGPKDFGIFVKRHWKKTASPAQVVKLFELIPLVSHELMTSVTYISIVFFFLSKPI